METTQTEIHTASVSQEFRAPRARVWGAIIAPPRMARWLCDDARVDLKLGGRYDFWGKSVYGWREGGETRHPIVGFDPGERIAFEWDFVTRGGVPTHSRVNLHVDPGSTPEHTCLAVEHEIEFP